MKHHLNGCPLEPRPTATARRTSRRWAWFIALSTACFLSAAGIIARWFPEYAAVAWALLLFSACHATFLLVQRVGCEPVAASGRRTEVAGRRDDSAPLP
jgi:hypothetical protein